jgi:hypothetical protein
MSGNEQEGTWARANPSAPFVSAADISTDHWPKRSQSRHGLITDMDGCHEVGRRCFARLRCAETVTFHLPLRPQYFSAHGHDFH